MRQTILPSYFSPSGVFSALSTSSVPNFVSTGSPSPGSPGNSISSKSLQPCRKDGVHRRQAERSRPLETRPEPKGGKLRRIVLTAELDTFEPLAEKLR